jgi:hypothetical protein
MLQKNIEIKVEKWQRKKVILRWHKDRKEKFMSAPSIHVGSFWLAHLYFTRY